MLRQQGGCTGMIDEFPEWSTLITQCLRDGGVGGNVRVENVGRGQQ